MDPMVYLVFYSNGNFHSSTTEMDIAWHRVRQIDGWIYHLPVYKALNIEEVVPPEDLKGIKSFLENPETGVRRGRLKRKIESTEVIDDPQ